MGRPKKIAIEEVEVPEIKEKKSKPKAKNERDKLTRSQAIKLQCIECMGYQKSLIKDCPDFGCPLWTFRLGKQEHTDAPIRTAKELKKEKKNARKSSK